MRIASAADHAVEASRWHTGSPPHYRVPFTTGTGWLVPDQLDVLVVGYGIAGGCAAVEAARRGRVGADPGASRDRRRHECHGWRPLLPGRRHRRAARDRHHDTPDEMYAYLMAVTPEPEPDKIRAYADGSAEHCDWLETWDSSSSAATTPTRRSSSRRPRA